MIRGICSTRYRHRLRMCNSRIEIYGSINCYVGPAVPETVTATLLQLTQALFRPSLVTLRSEPHGCIVSFSSESVPIHTFCSQGPSLIKNHNGAMHTGRSPLGMRVADPLVHHRRPSLKQEFAMEFTLPSSPNRPTTNSEGTHGSLCERHYSPHDGRGQGRTCQ